MSLLVTVQGGTGAGRKRPLKPAPCPWYCDCKLRQPGYLTKCSHCGKTRG